MSATKQTATMDTTDDLVLRRKQTLNTVIVFLAIAAIGLIALIIALTWSSQNSQHDAYAEMAEMEVPAQDPHVANLAVTEDNVHISLDHINAVEDARCAQMTIANHSDGQYHVSQTQHWEFTQNGEHLPLLDVSSLPEVTLEPGHFASGTLCFSGVADDEYEIVYRTDSESLVFRMTSEDEFHHDV